MTRLLDIVMGRKSVRSFDGSNLKPDDKIKLESYAAEIRNPFDIPVRFVFLDAEEHNLSSPVITGEKLYVAGKVEKKPYADVAFGYSFEKLVLYAWSMGIGTTWIGGTMRREAFERAAALSGNEMMPCISPLGYPAKKRSLKESMMRKGVRADTRYPVDQLFFNETLYQPLPEKIKQEMSDLIGMVRWAPSAVNKQPWRVVYKNNAWHFFEKKDKGYVKEETGDLQKIDVGIALCHFVMGLEELAVPQKVVIDNPGINIPDNMEYIASVVW